jgi:hypothetical protein
VRFEDDETKPARDKNRFMIGLDVFQSKYASQTVLIDPRTTAPDTK